MDGNVLSIVATLAGESEKRLQELMIEHKLDRKGVTKAFMKRPVELPLEVIAEVYRLDSYATIMNKANYVPVEVKDWRPKDYLDVLFSNSVAWFESSPQASEIWNRAFEMLKSPDANALNPSSDAELYGSMLLMAIIKKAHDDRELQRPQEQLLLGNDADRGDGGKPCDS